jgi:uncharacterized protein (DUF983 family)
MASLFTSVTNLNPFKKGKKLYSIIYLKCPRCQEGELFAIKNPYRLKYLDKMPHYCNKCGEDLQREVGFYYGAMMISHATTTLIAVIVHIIVFHFYGWAILPNLGSLLTILILSFPIVFRSSRAIWINFFCSYDPNSITKRP